jgi:hypothetical protein
MFNIVERTPHGVAAAVDEFVAKMEIEQAEAPKPARADRYIRRIAGKT